MTDQTIRLEHSKTRSAFAPPAPNELDHAPPTVRAGSKTQSPQTTSTASIARRPRSPALVLAGLPASFALNAAKKFQKWAGKASLIDVLAAGGTVAFLVAWYIFWSWLV